MDPDEVSARRSRVGLGLVTLLVTAQHFRPWNGGLLEEWGLERAWMDAGWHAFRGSFLSTLGRPLSAPIHYLGLAVSDGGVWGNYLLLAFAAIVQALLAFAIARSLRASAGWAVLFALVVGSHPLWPAGDLVRFLPAQGSVLGFLGAVLLLLRYLNDGRARHLLGSSLAAVAGLLAYPGLGAVLVVVAAAAAVAVPAPLVRRILACGVAAAAVLTAFGYSVSIAPRIYAGSYEAELIGSADMRPAPVAILSSILGTLWRDAPLVLVSGALLAIIAVAGLAGGRLRPTVAVAVLGLVIISPVTAFVYSTTSLHLNDPERVAFPVSTTLALAGAFLLADAGTATAGRVAIALIAVAAIVAVVAGAAPWVRFGQIQREVIGAIGPAVAAAHGTDVVVVQDHSGQLGDIYTFFPPTLSTASYVRHHDTSEVVLCTVDGVPRHQPIAERYPLVTTPPCSALTPRPRASDTFASRRLSTGNVDISVVSPVPD